MSVKCVPPDGVLPTPTCVLVIVLRDCFAGLRARGEGLGSNGPCRRMSDHHWSGSPRGGLIAGELWPLSGGHHGSHHNRWSPRNGPWSPRVEPSGIGPSSQAIPSQRSASWNPSAAASEERFRSVSSILSTKRPCLPRANAQQNRAVLAPPTCRSPEGLGANRVTATS